MTAATETKPKHTPVTWGEVCDAIGTTGIVTFDVKRQSLRSESKRAQYDTRMPAAILKDVDEESIGATLAEHDYPPGHYYLTPRTGTGRGDYWRPHGETVTVTAFVPKPEGYEEPEDDDEDDEVEAPESEGDEIEDLERQVRAEQLRNKIRSLREDRGGRADRSVGDLLSGSGFAVLAPIAELLIDRLTSRHQNPAEQAGIQLVTHQAKQMAELQTTQLGSIMQMQIDMLKRAQHEALGIPDKDESPVQQMLGVVTAALPSLLSNANNQSSGGEAPQTVTPNRTSAGNAPADAPVLFVRAICECMEQQPDQETIYGGVLKKHFGLLPKNYRLAFAIGVDQHGAINGFSQFVAEVDPDSYQRFLDLARQDDSAKWFTVLVEFFMNDFGQALIAEHHMAMSEVEATSDE